MAEENEGKDGVIVRAHRAENGRFLPGNPGGPGRTRREASKAVIDAIINNVDPLHVADTINRLLFMDSWRANYAGAKLYLDHIAGLPVARKEEVEEIYITLLEKLREQRRLKSE